MINTVTGRLEHWDAFATARYALRAYRTTNDTYAYFENIETREKSKTFSGLDAAGLLEQTKMLCRCKERDLYFSIRAKREIEEYKQLFIKDSTPC